MTRTFRLAASAAGQKVGVEMRATYSQVRWARDIEVVDITAVIEYGVINASPRAFRAVSAWRRSFQLSASRTGRKSEGSLRHGRAYSAMTSVLRRRVARHACGRD